MGNIVGNRDSKDSSVEEWKDSFRSYKSLLYLQLLNVEQSKKKSCLSKPKIHKLKLKFRHFSAWTAYFGIEKAIKNVHQSTKIAFLNSNTSQKQTLNLQNCLSIHFEKWGQKLSHSLFLSLKHIIHYLNQLTWKCYTKATEGGETKCDICVKCHCSFF